MWYQWQVRAAHNGDNEACGRTYPKAQSLSDSIWWETGSAQNDVPNDADKRMNYATTSSVFCAKNSSKGRRSSTRRIMCRKAKRVRFQSHLQESIGESTWQETGTIPNDGNKQVSGRSQRCGYREVSLPWEGKSRGSWQALLP
jgi:hypothetical protein